MQDGVNEHPTPKHRYIAQNMYYTILKKSKDALGLGLIILSDHKFRWRLVGVGRNPEPPDRKSHHAEQRAGHHPRQSNPESTQAQPELENGCNGQTGDDVSNRLKDLNDGI